MTAPAPITDHIDQALEKLIDYYKRKPRFAAWVAAHVRRWQEVEDCAQELKAAWDVDTCDLTRLRILAKIVGQAEIGTIEQFRMLVKVRIAVNRSRGKVSDIRQVADALIGAHTYHEPGNANIVVRAVEPLVAPVDPNLAAKLLRETKSAGVGLQLVYPTHKTLRFRYSSAANPITNQDTGFDTVTDSVARGRYSAVA
jgi:hypothetical protein